MRANRINTTTVPVDANGGPRAERREPGLGGADQPAGAGCPLMAGYQAMAADRAREAEAREWCQALAAGPGL